MSEIGVLLYINHNNYMFIWNAMGEGADNRYEMITLWNLLKIEIKKEIKNLQFMGESKLVID
jgi:hypothetical protein